MASRSLTRMSAGKALFIERLDGRSVLARRFREVYQRILGDDHDDDNPPTEARHQLARRAALLSIEAELIEAAFAQGQEVDMDRYCRISNSLSRLLTKLGARLTGPEEPKWPSVAEYAAAKRRKTAA